MLHRYDQSRQRNYSELCSRSTSRSCLMGHQFCAQMSYATDSCEDYWEDASVSIRSFHGRKVPATDMAQSAACSLASKEGEGEREAPMAPASHQFRPHRDLNEYTACSKRRHSFPPPLALCSTLSIKEGGRFVLKEMDAGRPQGFFRVQRGNGRLRLQLVITDENIEQEDDHEESCNAEMDMAEYSEAHCEETNTSSDRDCSASDNNGSRSISGDDEGGLDMDSDGNGIRRGTHDDDDDDDDDECLEGMVYSDASLPWLSCNMELNQFAAENVRSSGSNEEEESLWSMDVSNQALASLSPWTAKPMCMHASPLVSMIPSSIGLAMS